MKCFKYNEEVSVVRTIHSYKIERDEYTASKSVGDGMDVCKYCYAEMKESDKFTIEG